MRRVYQETPTPSATWLNTTQTWRQPQGQCQTKTMCSQTEWNIVHPQNKVLSFVIIWISLERLC